MLLFLPFTELCVCIHHFAYACMCAHMCVLHFLLPFSIFVVFTMLIFDYLSLQDNKFDNQLTCTDINMSFESEDVMQNIKSALVTDDWPHILKHYCSSLLPSNIYQHNMFCMGPSCFLLDLYNVIWSYLINYHVCIYINYIFG